MCFAPQRCALFRHLNVKKWSEPRSFLHTWLENVNSVHFFDIWTSKSGPRMVCFVHFDLEMRFAPERRALFRHLNFPKWSEAGVFCTFWLGNVLRTGTACTFSTSQRRKVFRRWCVLWILTSKCASHHNSAQLFIFHLASWLRTRRFSEPTFRPSWATSHWKKTVNRDFPTFSRTFLFFLPSRLSFSSLIFSLLFFSSLTLPSFAFPTVHIVGSFTSKLLYIYIYLYMKYIIYIFLIICIYWPHWDGTTRDGSDWNSYPKIVSECFWLVSYCNLSRLIGNQRFNASWSWRLFCRIKMVFSSFETIIFGDVSRVHVTNQHGVWEKPGIQFDALETVKFSKTNLQRWLKMVGTISVKLIFFCLSSSPSKHLQQWGSLAATASQIPTTWWKWVPRLRLDQDKRLNCKKRRQGKPLIGAKTMVKTFTNIRAFLLRIFFYINPLIIASQYVFRSIERAEMTSGVRWFFRIQRALCRQTGAQPRCMSSHRGSKNGRSNQGSPDLTMKPAPDHAGSVQRDPTWWLPVDATICHPIWTEKRDRKQYLQSSIGHELAFLCPCNVDFSTFFGPGFFWWHLLRWTLEPGLAQRKASGEVGRTGLPKLCRPLGSCLSWKDICCRWTWTVLTTTCIPLAYPGWNPEGPAPKNSQRVPWISPTAYLSQQLFFIFGGCIGILFAGYVYYQI